MPHIEKHAPGSFNWIDLGTTDQHAAKRFYGELLGWQAEDMEGARYTWFKLDGRNTAGCYAIPSTGPTPSHWGIYVAVKNADEVAARVAGLGGTVVHPPGDVAGYGRMAVIQDPTGAVISLWQAKDHIGTGIAGEIGTMVWADLNTPDRLRAKEFYESLFGWSFVTGKDKPADSYLHIKNGDAHMGGILPESHRNKDAPPHWLIYFLTADCDASTEKARELGARVYVPPMTIENALRFSVLADPQGAVFALFQGRV